MHAQTGIYFGRALRSELPQAALYKRSRTFRINPCNTPNTAPTIILHVRVGRTCGKFPHLARTLSMAAEFLYPDRQVDVNICGEKSLVGSTKCPVNRERCGNLVGVTRIRFRLTWELQVLVNQKSSQLEQDSGNFSRNFGFVRDSRDLINSLKPCLSILSSHIYYLCFNNWNESTQFHVSNETRYVFLGKIDLTDNLTMRTRNV